MDEGGEGRGDERSNDGSCDHDGWLGSEVCGWCVGAWSLMCRASGARRYKDQTGGQCNAMPVMRWTYLCVYLALNTETHRVSAWDAKVYCSRAVRRLFSGGGPRIGSSGGERRATRGDRRIRGNPSVQVETNDRTRVAIAMRVAGRDDCDGSGWLASVVLRLVVPWVLVLGLGGLVVSDQGSKIGWSGRSKPRGLDGSGSDKKGQVKPRNRRND